MPRRTRGWLKALKKSDNSLKTDKKICDSLQMVHLRIVTNPWALFYSYKAGETGTLVRLRRCSPDPAEQDKRATNTLSRVIRWSKGGGIRMIRGRCNSLHGRSRTYTNQFTVANRIWPKEEWHFLLLHRLQKIDSSDDSLLISNTMDGWRYQLTDDELMF